MALKTIAHCSFSAAILLVLMFIIIPTPLLHAFGQTTTNAAYLYQNKSLMLPPNIRHLVILIPNEAHESLNQPRDQYPLADQPYLPQNTIVSPGTMISWFNGDVDHDHKVTLTKEQSPNAVFFDSGIFTFNEASRPIILNDTGTYNYYEANVNDNDEDFMMRGNITVVSQANLNGTSSSTTNSSSSSPINNADTAGVLMLPTQDIEEYMGTLRSHGFAIDSTYDFKDFRGGQSGTGDQQTLLIWTTSGIALDQIISNLQGITSNLPYS